MNQRPPQSDAFSDLFAWKILSRLAEDKRVQRKIPGDGVIHFDRRLPFLFVFRPSPDDEEKVEQPLVTAEAAYLIAPTDGQAFKATTRMLDTISQTLSNHFGAFLIVDVWCSPRDQLPQEQHAESGETVHPAPAFKVFANASYVPRQTVDTLAKSLRRIQILKRSAEVSVEENWNGRPTDRKPLISARQAKRNGCYLIGLEIRPVYRDSTNGHFYPRVFRRLRRGLERALKQAVFTFVRMRTNMRPKHFYTLGRRAVSKNVWEVDRQLAELSNSFDFLWQATPINAEASWRDFYRSQFEVTPYFNYRPLAMDPAMLKRRLYAIPIERVEDPTIAFLFRQKQDELDRKITMLSDVGTRKFLLGSLQVYGGVPPQLLALAKEMVERISPRSRENTAGGQLDAEQFAARARAEVEYYRQTYRGFTPEVTIREDMYTGLLTSKGNLYIGHKTLIPAGRVDALIQHELGTHSVTYFNGRAQPFQQLYTGLAGYDVLQEGLAVLSEYLVGGLSRPRMRLLAARVVAAQRMLEGATFVDTFRLLDRTYEFSQRTAYTITMRVYRGGGLTKDVVYLQGLVQMLEYLKDGGEINPLLVGKIAADHIPLITELRHRHVLRAPPLRPRFLDHPQAAKKIARLRQGMTVLDLIKPK